MNNIIEPNDSFDFTKLSLGHPNGIQGGAYFTKILNNGTPLYIQTTKSFNRQGFVKTGKKYYCDLMFDNNSEVLIRWFENLEEVCQKLIFEKSEAWFQNSLDKNDVETAFNSILRIYKSGKYYLLRSYVKNNINNEPAIKIYDENELPLTINDINSDTQMISILEIQGIKFTSRNFQIEIELKQIMVLDKEPIFDNCLIKTSLRKNILDNKKNEEKIDCLETTLEKTENSNTLEKNNDLNIHLNIDKDSTNNKDNDNNDVFNDNNLFSNNDVIFDNFNNDEVTQSDQNDNDNLNMKEEENTDGKMEETNTETLPEINKEQNISLDFEDLNKEDLKEVDLNINLENNLETFTLKKPNQVYYELYKEAREKAKLAKKAAIIAYLEAKNIKKTYMLENIENDSDIDEEIDEVSESELEDFE
jgi:hypothetical protein